MGAAINQLMEISADEKMRELYRAREKARLDMISRLKYAENKGIAKGLEEGAIKKARGMAIELIKDGVEVNLVVKYTKLAKNEVEKIKKQLNG